MCIFKPENVTDWGMKGKYRPYSDGESNIVSVSFSSFFEKNKLVNGIRWFLVHLTLTVVLLLSLRHLCRKTALVLCRPSREIAFFLTF